MGIESFFGRFINKKYNEAVRNRLPTEVASLFIDCNGIFHSSAQKVYGYGEGRNNPTPTDPKATEPLLNSITEKLEEILKTVAPSTNFVLAPDGVAPMAKLNQQKSRRFISSMSRESGFDSNQFTPATELMIKIDKKINDWFKLGSTKSVLPTKTIYSSHLEQGEGEHKIFNFIRDDKIIKAKGAHVVYGLDSDLIILSLLSPMKNIYLLRENYRSVLDIDTLRELIMEELCFKGCDRDKIIKDFSIICMFAGNDFLPKLPSFSSVDQFLKVLFGIYKRMKFHLTDDENNIDFNRLMLVLEEFSKKEDYLLEEIIDKRLHKYPYPELLDCVNYSRLDKPKFVRRWYSKQFAPQTAMLREKYPEGYYSPQDVGRMSFSFLKTMQWVHKYYTEGHLTVDNTHFYPYIYAPLGQTLYSILRKMFSDYSTAPRRIAKLQDVIGNGEIITPIHQLLLVLPYGSRDVIPPSVITIYDDYMSLINPMEFTVKHEGTNTEWHRTAIIPPVNLKLVQYALGKINYSLEGKYESKPHSVIENHRRNPTVDSYSRSYIHTSTEDHTIHKYDLM